MLQKGFVPVDANGLLSLGQSVCFFLGGKEMIVYNQKIQKGEPKVYIGEDAHPYAKDGILLVADGLGGRGGYPHKKADRGIVDKDKFYELVFGDVFKGDVDEDFVDYVENGFSEIFEMKDYYFECESAIRTSGYFASRLVAAIALYEIKYVKAFGKEKLFEDIQNNQDKIDDVLSEYAQKLAIEIRDKLEKIAKKIDLEIETSVTGAYLLPTTLQIALVKEEKKSVRAVFLWAGDSRAYMWNKDGLAQITDDHEDAETMYNLITLSRDFKIESRYASFDKPCVVFVATDGCYKCSCYASPLEMEMTFLEAFYKANSTEEAALNFEEEYKRIGRHDDSNSMALQMFGYNDFKGKEDYDVFKRAVKDRLYYIKKHIVSRLSDIFEADYSDEAQKIEEKKDDIILENATDWINSNRVFQYVFGLMREAQYEPFIKAKEEFLEKLHALEAKVEIAKKKTMDWFDDNKKQFLSESVNEEDNETLFDMLLRGELSGQYVSFNIETHSAKQMRKLAEKKEEFRAILDELSAIDEEQNDLCGRQQRDMIAQCTMRFWRTRRNEIIRKIWEEKRDLLDAQECEEKEEKLAALEEENEQILKKIGVRDEIYAEYERSYKKYFKGARV